MPRDSSALKRIMKTLTRLVGLLTLLALFGFRATAGTVKWGGGGDNLTWTSAANWQGAALPTTTDDAVHDNTASPLTPATLQVNSSITVGGIEFLSGFNAANTVT